MSIITTTIFFIDWCIQCIAVAVKYAFYIWEHHILSCSIWGFCTGYWAGFVTKTWQPCFQACCRSCYGFRFSTLIFTFIGQNCLQIWCWYLLTTNTTKAKNKHNTAQYELSANFNKYLVPFSQNKIKYVLYFK